MLHSSVRLTKGSRLQSKRTAACLKGCFAADAIYVSKNAICSFHWYIRWHGAQIALWLYGDHWPRSKATIP